MRSRLVLLFLLWSSCQSGFTQNNPLIPGADRLRLAEAFKLAESVGNRVWKDWDKAPFAVLLVTPEYEFLIRHPAPSPDFMPLGYDSLLKSDVYYRR